MVAIFVSSIVPSSKIEVESEQIDITYIDKDYSVWEIITSPIDGLIGKSDGETIRATNEGTNAGVLWLVVLILAIGGFVTLCTKAGVFDQLIDVIIKSKLRLEYITILLIIYFVTSATTFGLYESAVCYIPLLLSLYQKYNVEKKYPIKLLIFSLSIGYIASPINPFATIVADQIALVTTNNLFARSVLLFTLTAILIIYMLIELRTNDVKVSLDEVNSTVAINKLNICLFFIPYIYMTIGFTSNFLFSATMQSVSLAFVITAIIVGLNSKYNLLETIKIILLGLRGFAPIVIAIILARSVYIILYNSKVIDTIIYWIVSMISDYNVIVILFGTGLLLLVLGYLIPSPSALAMLTLPVLAPALGLVGIDQFIVVTIFLLAHGLTKISSITSPLVITAINQSEIGYLKYLRSVALFMLIVTVTVSIFIKLI